MTLAQLFLLIRSCADQPEQERRGTLDDLLEMQAMAERAGHRG